MAELTGPCRQVIWTTQMWSHLLLFLDPNATQSRRLAILKTHRPEQSLPRKTPVGSFYRYSVKHWVFNFGRIKNGLSWKHMPRSNWYPSHLSSQSLPSPVVPTRHSVDSAGEFSESVDSHRTSDLWVGRLGTAVMVVIRGWEPTLLNAPKGF